MSWRKFLIIPQLIAHGVRAPRTQRAAWDRYWSGIRKTGAGGEVLWDDGGDAELDAALARMRPHMDLGLPMLDLGCGHGRVARALAAHAPEVIGVDGSERAVAHARVESAAANVTFEVADATAAGLGRALHDAHGDMNVHVRGVLHVLDEPGRRAAAANIRDALGARGVLYLCETNIASPLDHLEFQGATLTSMPDPLRRCIAAGIRPPTHFGDREVRACFPAPAWQVLASGEAVMHGVPLHEGRTIEDIPSWYAVVRPRD